MNHKLLSVGLEGTGLYFRAISWCAKKETDGKIPKGVIPSLTPELSAAARKKLIENMTNAEMQGTRDPLWSENGVAFIIHDYLKYNPTHEQLEAKREAERLRIQSKRKPTTEDVGVNT